MKKNFVLILTFVLSFTILLSLTACKMEPAEEPSYAGTMTDNVLQAINEGDYTKFSQDFDEAMKKALPETKFVELKDKLNDKIGQYISKETTLVQKKDNLYIVVYKAVYSKSGSVKITISFRESGSRTQIAGLYFDAPELR